jgi:ribosomal protein S18 acetylase RimI-like enzyme
MEIHDFEPRYAAAFKALNEAWITKHYSIEPKDEELLGDPAGRIIAKGGMIPFAVEEGEPVGCCAMIPMADGGFELSKMAVSEAHRRRGIASMIIKACVERAKARGASRLYLESGLELTPAIALYESLGFVHLPPERRPWSPYARVSVWMERVL